MRGHIPKVRVKGCVSSRMLNGNVPRFQMKGYTSPVKFRGNPPPRVKMKKCVPLVKVRGCVPSVKMKECYDRKAKCLSFAPGNEVGDWDRVVTSLDWPRTYFCVDNRVGSFTFC